MSLLKGACLFGQSGGPTSVINASATGVFQEALKQDCITAVYGACHGIKGILDEELIDISKEDALELEHLKYTPSSALGSVRYKLKDVDVDETDYKRILEVFKKYNVRYFFYNGGNDSMDTCNKISKYLQKQNYECRVIGVPKTIDNDLYGTDHCPGYASAAKYVATSFMELKLDTRVYDTPLIVVVEIMGRHAGWLTAASALASTKGLGPDLVYVPERDFNQDEFLEDVKAQCKEKNSQVIIAVSEGIHDKDGKFIAEYGQSLGKDSFGHAQLGGVALYLASFLRQELGLKVRPIELSLLQRCASHCASQTDIDEAVNAGKIAVQYAVQGETDKMVTFQRRNQKDYAIDYELINLTYAANTEKKIPQEWINERGNGINQQFIDYALPLIQGELKQEKEDGLPRFANLKKVLVKK